MHRLLILICSMMTTMTMICLPIHMSSYSSKDIVTKQNSLKKNTAKQKSKKASTHVHLTCYQPISSQCNSDPLHTADGSKIDLKKLKNGSIKWVAISRDLEWLFPMGSKVKISNEQTGEVYGIYEVHDRMNRRWKHRMDILIHPSSKKRISEKNIKIELI